MRLFLLIFLCINTFIFANEDKLLPTGFSLNQNSIKNKTIIPLDPHLKKYPEFIAGGAVRMKISPDKTKIAILTSGYNLLYNNKGNLDKNNSTEYIFIYSSSQKPKLLQVIKIPNSFYGFVWSHKSNSFYVSGGKDDVVYKYKYINDKYKLVHIIKLMHNHGVVKSVKPMVAEMALTKDEKYLVVVNLENDSVSLIDTQKNKVINEADLRPDNKTIAGGTYPFGIAITENNFVYVSSMRDNELVKLHIKNNKLRVIKHIKVGSQPTELTYDSKHHILIVCESRSDTVRFINTKNDKTLSVFPTLVPREYDINKKNLKGANPNSIYITPDDKKLYVTNGGTNSVACYTLIYKGNKLNIRFDGLIPTLWYANDVLAYKNRLYIINGKSLSGPNKYACFKNADYKNNANKLCKGNNEFVWQTKHSYLEIIDLPKKDELINTTIEVLKNNHMLRHSASKQQIKTVKFLQKHIRHIIYVIKENRSYDQVLGDLKSANGDSSLTLFHKDVAPNHYALARNFVALDNFMASGSVSGDGWVWCTAGHTTEYVEQMIPNLYARRGFSYDVEGQNRNIPVSYKSLKERDKISPQTKKENMLLPGDNDVAAPDGPEGEAGAGYLWNSALRKGLSIRNYGFFCNVGRYFLNKKDPNYVIPYKNSYKKHYRQCYPNEKALFNITDPYFRGFDMTYPDLWRVKEFLREYKNYCKNKNLPFLMLVRLPHDHFGSFSKALAKVNTPKRQMADNDYSIGLLVEAVANSPYKESTLIFIVEDDAQDGADHVSAQRTVAFVVGPYVKHHATVSIHYTTVNMLKTIETILSIQPLGLNDYYAQFMYDVFSIKQKKWNYKAIVPDILYATDLKLPKPKSKIFMPKEHSNKYWSRVMKGQDFDEPDHLDTEKFNKALWVGIKGTKFEIKKLKRDKHEK